MNILPNPNHNPQVSPLTDSVSADSVAAPHPNYLLMKPDWDLSDVMMTNSRGIRAYKETYLSLLSGERPIPPVPTIAFDEEVRDDEGNPTGDTETKTVKDERRSL